MPYNEPLLPTGQFGGRRARCACSPQFMIRPRGRALGVSSLEQSSAHPEASNLIDLHACLAHKPTIRVVVVDARGAARHASAGDDTQAS